MFSHFDETGGFRSVVRDDVPHTHHLLELLGVLLALKAVWPGLRPKTMVLVRSVNTTVVTVCQRRLGALRVSELSLSHGVVSDHEERVVHEWCSSKVCSTPGRTLTFSSSCESC